MAASQKRGKRRITPEQARLVREHLIPEMVRIKARCGELGMFATMHAMDQATRAVGYELEEVQP